MWTPRYYLTFRIWLSFAAAQVDICRDPPRVTSVIPTPPLILTSTLTNTPRGMLYFDAHPDTSLIPQYHVSSWPCRICSTVILGMFKRWVWKSLHIWETSFITLVVVFTIFMRYCCQSSLYLEFNCDIVDNRVLYIQDSGFLVSHLF